MVHGHIEANLYCFEFQILSQGWPKKVEGKELSECDMENSQHNLDYIPKSDKWGSASVPLYKDQ